MQGKSGMKINFFCAAQIGLHKGFDVDFGRKQNYRLK